MCLQCRRVWLINVTHQNLEFASPAVHRCQRAGGSSHASKDEVSAIGARIEDRFVQEKRMRRRRRTRRRKTRSRRRLRASRQTGSDTPDCLLRLLTANRSSTPGGWGPDCDDGAAGTTILCRFHRCTSSKTWRFWMWKRESGSFSIHLS